MKFPGTSQIIYIRNLYQITDARITSLCSEILVIKCTIHHINEGTKVKVWLLPAIDLMFLNEASRAPVQHSQIA